VSSRNGEHSSRLAERRLSATRSYLVDAAGIKRDRLAEDPEPPPTGAAGAGRVEFALGAS
jgi:hypothetical protein